MKDMILTNPYEIETEDLCEFERDFTVEVEYIRNEWSPEIKSVRIDGKTIDPKTSIEDWVKGLVG